MFWGAVDAVVNAADVWDKALDVWNKALVGSTGEAVKTFDNF